MAERRERSPRQQAPAFQVDDRIQVSVEYELAGELGKLILDSDTANTALLALGHQLRNLMELRGIEEEYEEEYEEEEGEGGEGEV
jgi:hypothetical protein